MASVNIKTVSILLFLLPGLQFSTAWAQPELSHTLTPVKKPYIAKNFELKNMDEETIKLSDFRGKVVLLNFWATWCPPCRREIPSMERIYNKLKNKKFVVLAINQMESEDQIFTYTAQLKTNLTFNILLDKKSRVAEQFGIVGLPTTYLIDKKGMIRYRAIGGREFDYPEVEKIIQKLVAE